jgi:hypothetical protein
MAALTVKLARIHPLRGLTADEIQHAGAILTKIQKAKSGDASRTVRFQHITLSEPPKALLMPYLDAENSLVEPSNRPWVPRCAKITWSQVHDRRDCESIVSLDTESEVAHIDAKVTQHNGLDRYVPSHGQLCRRALMERTEMRSSLQPSPFSPTPRSWPRSRSSNCPKTSQYNAIPGHLEQT